MNRSAMTVFLWHQTSLLLVSLLVPGVMVGLQTVPDGASWLAARLLWLPVFAAGLAGCVAVFHRFERPPPPPPRSPAPARRAHVAA
ncbi:hypothetical protein GCM10020218_055160 [Dactylosporangium vinaceum]